MAKYKSGYWISNALFCSAFIATGDANVFVLSHNRGLFNKGYYQAK